jgi:hypothetical protein
MGMNYAFLVLAGSDRTEVVNAIAEHYVGLGARIIADSHVPIRPLSISQGTDDRLGVVVSGPHDGWIVVRDSERYHADANLARALAERLQRPVRYVGFADASQYEANRWFGPAPDEAIPLEASDRGSVYWTDSNVTEPEDQAFVVFAGVKASSYDDGGDEVWVEWPQDDDDDDDDDER